MNYLSANCLIEVNVSKASICCNILLFFQPANLVETAVLFQVFNKVFQYLISKAFLSVLLQILTIRISMKKDQYCFSFISRMESWTCKSLSLVWHYAYMAVLETSVSCCLKYLIL